MPRTEEYEERKVAEREDRNAAWLRLVEAWNEPVEPQPPAHLNSLYEGSDV